MFVLTVGYPLTRYYYIIERLYFIYRLFILFISTFSFLQFWYLISWRYKRDYLHASRDILFCIMFYIINMMKKQTLLYGLHTYDTKMVLIWTHPPHFTICSYAFVSAIILWKSHLIVIPQKRNYRFWESGDK